MVTTRGLLLVACFGLIACGPSGGDDVQECEAALLPGDLVITEIMGNPEGPDEGKEWFEIYNATGQTVDVTGLQLVASREDGTSEKVHVMSQAILDAGDYFVVGGILTEFKPPYMHYGYASDLGSLNNSSGRLALRCGSTLVDEALYAGMTSGKALGLDGSATPDHTANDNLLNWCESANEFETGQFGTPGAANDPCNNVAPTECNDNGTTRPVVSPEAGDIVITEVMPDPSAATDEVGEWFEVAVLKDVDLNGLNYGRTAGQSEGGLASADCIRVTAGTHLVIARSDDMITNGGLPRVDGTFDFGLTNSAGTLYVGVGESVLDEVSWTGASSGVSIGLDPRNTNPTDNDDPMYWCAPGTADTYGDGDRGTPGDPNPECEIPPPPGMCFEGETLRATVPPELGDIVITEIMPDPSAVSDAAGEWFEVTVLKDVDINGLNYGRTAGTPEGEVISLECVRITAGTQLVFARSDVMATNGGLPRVDGTFSFALTNSAGTIFVGVDQTVLDEASWTGSTAGVSISLDPTNTNPTDNDDPMNWCAPGAGDTYGDGDRGTPGDANPECVIPPPPGMCYDGLALRAVVKPIAGDLVITEVMPDPTAVNDTFGEYIEVRANADVDLNGLQLGVVAPTVLSTFDSSSCVPLMANDYAVFARSDVFADNGMIPGVVGTLGFGLNNSNSSVFIGIDDTPLDSFSWASSPAGQSHALNETTMAWCTTTTAETYGAGDHGTPGDVNTAANLACP